MATKDLVRGKGIIVTVSAHGLSKSKAEFVKREIAVALSNIGAFDVVADGDFSNGNGQSCDPERMRVLAELAADGLNIYVEVE